MKQVDVNLSCWQGYSIGASHYYVKISYRGVDNESYTAARAKFDTYEAAKAWIDKQLAEYFPPDQYTYASTGETAIQFIYDRVGD